MVYYYFSKWTNAEDLTYCLPNLGRKFAENKGQNSEPSLGIMNSQSVGWGNKRIINGFDGRHRIRDAELTKTLYRNGH